MQTYNEMIFFMKWIIFKTKWATIGSAIGAVLGVITGILKIRDYFENKQDKKRKIRENINEILIKLKEEVENDAYYATDEKIKEIVTKYWNSVLKIKHTIDKKDLEKLTKIGDAAINFQEALLGINLDKTRPKDPFRGSDSEDRKRENSLEEKRQTAYFDLLNSIYDFLKN